MVNENKLLSLKKNFTILTALIKIPHKWIKLCNVKCTWTSRKQTQCFYSTIGTRIDYKVFVGCVGEYASTLLKHGSISIWQKLLYACAHYFLIFFVKIYSPRSFIVQHFRRQALSSMIVFAYFESVLFVFRRSDATDWKSSKKLRIRY